MQNSPLSLFLKYKDRIYRIGGYIAFGILIFTVSIFLTFPSRKVASIISRAIERESGLKVSIETVSPRLPIGISAKNISINELNSKIHKLDYVSLSPSIIPFMAGSPKGRYSLGMGKTRLRGTARVKKNRIETDFKLTSDSLKELLREFSLKGIEGSLKGEVNLSLNGKRVKNQNWPKAIERGESSIILTDLELTPSALNKALSFIPPLKMDMISASISILKGMAKIKKIDISGDIEGSIVGGVNLLMPAGKSALSLDIKLKPSDRILKKVGPLISLIKNKKGKDGYYNLKVRGTIAKPNLIN